jgi:haloacetate dehalogenase
MSITFANDKWQVANCMIDFAIAGNGPALLLLHGFPETKLAWHKLAAQLATDHTLVIPDLPGYGDSNWLDFDAENKSYSKRNMGVIMTTLMKHLGFESYAVAGHDRGGRVAYRMALDHPSLITGLAVLNIIPTLEVIERLNYDKALVMENWLFLSQPAPFPETLLSANPSFYLNYILDSWSLSPQLISPASRDEYLRCFTKPEVIAGICSEYRANKLDAAYDLEDRNSQRRIHCPTLVLWSENDFSANEPLLIWENWAENITGKGLPCGHFLMEEAPDETVNQLIDFFSKLSGK